jgi:Tfp pilus assembly protein PilN
VPLLTKVGVGGLAVLFIFTILLVYFTLSQERYVEQLEEEYASISDLKSENVKQWFLILNLLEKSLPEDVYVHTLKIEDNGDVYIRIISKSYDGIMQFYNAIINKKMFEQIKQGSISKFTEAGSYLYKFDIKAKLTSKK